MASRILSEAANELWGAAGRSHKHKNNITAERHSKSLNSRNHRTNRRQKISTNIYRNTVEERNSNTNSTAAERDVTRRLPRYMQSTIASSRNFERSHRQRNRKRGKKKLGMLIKTKKQNQQGTSIAMSMCLSQLSIHHHGIKVVIQKLITHLTVKTMIM